MGCPVNITTLRYMGREASKDAHRHMRALLNSHPLSLLLTPNWKLPQVLSSNIFTCISSPCVLNCNQSLLRSDLKEEEIILTRSLGSRVCHGGEAVAAGNSVVGEGAVGWGIWLGLPTPHISGEGEE